MKSYAVKFNLKVWEKGSESCGYYGHSVTIQPQAHNKLEAINIGISFLDTIATSCWEEEKLGEKLGRKIRIGKWEIEKIESIKVVEEDEN